MKKINLLFMLPIVGLLFSCGTDDSDDPEKKITHYKITGHVIDIVGADVFLDLNQNGKRDNSEPSDVSGPKGYYSFNVKVGTAPCLGVTPIVATVDGAKDGVRFVSGGSIDGMFTLVRPPSYYIIYDETEYASKNISVITTMSWAPVPLPINLDGTMGACRNEDSTDFSPYAEQQKIFSPQKKSIKIFIKI